MEKETISACFQLEMKLRMFISAVFLCGDTRRTAGFSTSSTSKTCTNLSDLPTPSLILDLMAIEKIRGCTSFEMGIPPSLRIGDWLLQPARDDSLHQPAKSTLTMPQPERLEDLERRGDLTGDICFGYVHTKVLESRREGEYLALLDLPTGTDAHLVLGLNNHHVVSYYWARSAGAGAAMEAPGIALRGGNRLEWDSESGKFTDCNSNDGKRSEWVNFLKPGDQMQLRPNNHHNGLAMSIPLFRDSIYGISSAGRPLGAEPIVVCRFEATQL